VRIDESAVGINAFDNYFAFGLAVFSGQHDTERLSFFLGNGAGIFTNNRCTGGHSRDEDVAFNRSNEVAGVGGKVRTAIDVDELKMTQNAPPKEDHALTFIPEIKAVLMKGLPSKKRWIMISFSCFPSTIPTCAIHTWLWDNNCYDITISVHGLVLVSLDLCLAVNHAESHLFFLLGVDLVLTSTQQPSATV